MAAGAAVMAAGAALVTAVVGERALLLCMGGGGMGPMMRGGPMVGGRSAMFTAPGTFSRNHVGWGSHDHVHDHDHDRGHDHHRFHNRFFAFGFAGPYYAYSSCWTQVPSYYGWRWVYVCGDYPY
jgi:hypothetical protein